MLLFKKFLKSIEGVSILASRVGPISTKYLLNLFVTYILRVVNNSIFILKCIR